MSMKTKIKHKARGVDKAIVALADAIGLPLSRRNKELWLGGDIQLTFRKRKVGDHVYDADDADRVLMAVEILRNILDARKDWGTLGERFRKVWQGLSGAAGKYISGTYTYHYEPTLDHGWMIRVPYSPRCEMGIVLCGYDEKIRVEGETFAECLAKLAVDERFGE